MEGFWNSRASMPGVCSHQTTGGKAGCPAPAFDFSSCASLSGTFLGDCWSNCPALCDIVLKVMTIPLTWQFKRWREEWRHELTWQTVYADPISLYFQSLSEAVWFWLSATCGFACFSSVFFIYKNDENITAILSIKVDQEKAFNLVHGTQWACVVSCTF